MVFVHQVTDHVDVDDQKMYVQTLAEELQCPYSRIDFANRKTVEVALEKVINLIR